MARNCQHLLETAGGLQELGVASNQEPARSQGHTTIREWTLPTSWVSTEGDSSQVEALDKNPAQTLQVRPTRPGAEGPAELCACAPT